MESAYNLITYFIIFVVALFLAANLFLLGCGLVNKYWPNHKAVRSYTDPEDDNIYQG